MSVGTVNLRFHVGLSAPEEAWIRVALVASRILQHAMQDKRVLKVRARRATSNQVALLRNASSHVVHLCLSDLLTSSYRNRCMRLVVEVVRELARTDVPFGSVHGCGTTLVSG